jgi:hypothetical protein
LQKFLLFLPSSQTLVNRGDFVGRNWGGKEAFLPIIPGSCAEELIFNFQGPAMGDKYPPVRPRAIKTIVGEEETKVKTVRTAATEGSENKGVIDLISQRTKLGSNRRPDVARGFSQVFET